MIASLAAFAVADQGELAEGGKRADLRTPGMMTDFRGRMCVRAGVVVYVLCMYVCEGLRRWSYNTRRRWMLKRCSWDDDGVRAGLCKEQESQKEATDDEVGKKGQGPGGVPISQRGWK